MQPNDREIGVILEPTDIDVANNVRALLWEKFESGRPPEAQQTTFKAPLEPNENGVLALDEAASRHMVNHAQVAAREATIAYREKDRKLDFLMASCLFDTDEYKAIEVVLPQLAGKAKAFGSLATTTEACILESQKLVTGHSSVSK